MYTSTTRAAARLLYLFISLLLCACASSRFTSVWRDPADSNVAIQRVAIFAVLKDDSIGQFVENEAVRQMPKTLHAEAGHMIGVQPSLGQTEVRDKLNRAGFDAAIITRLVSIDETEVYHPPQMYFESDRWAFSPYYRSFWNFYPYAGATVYTPGYATRDKRYVVETILYRLPEGKPVWSAVSETVNPSSTLVMVNEIVGLINKQLQRAGLIGSQ